MRIVFEEDAKHYRRMRILNYERMRKIFNDDSILSAYMLSDHCAENAFLITQPNGLRVIMKRITHGPMHASPARHKDEGGSNFVRISYEEFFNLSPDAERIIMCFFMDKFNAL